MLTRSEAQAHNKKMRSYYLNKFNYKCVKCGDDERLELDHILAITMGGDNSEDNIQVLCKSCNVKKGGNKHRDKRQPTLNPKIIKTLSLSKEEIEEGKKQAKEKGLSFSTYVGQLIRANI